MATKNLATTVIGLQDLPIAPIAPTAGQALVWNGNAWAPAFAGGSGGGITAVNAGIGLGGGGNSGAVTLNLMAPVSIPLGGTGQATAPAALAALGGLPIAGGTVTGNLTVNGQLTGAGNIVADGGSYTGSNFYGPAGGFSLLAPGNVNASVIDLWANTTQMLGAATVNGNLYSAAAISAAGQITTNSDVIGNNSVQSNGVYFQNNQGWFYTPQNFCAGGAIAPSSQFGNGVYWTDSGGWMDCPVGVMCNNIQTGDIHSSASITAAGNLYATDGDIQAGGRLLAFNGEVTVQIWGIQYISTGSSNEVALPWVGALFCYVDSGQQGYIQITPSDARIKSNVVEASRDALEVICSTPLYEFDRTTLESRHFDVGFMAQDMEGIPGCVMVPPPTALDPDPIASLDLLPLVAYAWKAIQQLNAKIEALGG